MKTLIDEPCMISKTEHHDTRSEVVANADAYLSNIGLPTYTELLAMLGEAQRLGLTFDIGNAYIRRQYIDKQNELNTRINAAIAIAHEAKFTFQIIE